MRDEWFCHLKSKATGSQGIGGLFLSYSVATAGRNNVLGRRRIRVGYAWARFANEAAKRNFDLLAFKPTEYAPEELIRP